MYRSYETAGNGASSKNDEDDDLYSGYNNANEDEVVYGNVSETARHSEFVKDDVE